MYVVGPRYVDGDTVVWTSTDGGATFGAGTVILNGYDAGNPENVLLQGSNLLIGATGSSNLWFGSTPLPPGPAGKTFEFTPAPPGLVATGSLAPDQNGNPSRRTGPFRAPPAWGTTTTTARRQTRMFRRAGLDRYRSAPARPPRSQAAARGFTC